MDCYFITTINKALAVSVLNKPTKESRGRNIYEKSNAYKVLVQDLITSSEDDIRLIDSNQGNKFQNLIRNSVDVNAGEINKFGSERIKEFFEQTTGSVGKLLKAYCDVVEGKAMPDDIKLPEGVHSHRLTKIYIYKVLLVVYFMMKSNMEKYMSDVVKLNIVLGKVSQQFVRTSEFNILRFEICKHIKDGNEIFIEDLKKCLSELNDKFLIEQELAETTLRQEAKKQREMIREAEQKKICMEKQKLDQARMIHEQKVSLHKKTVAAADQLKKSTQGAAVSQSRRVTVKIGGLISHPIAIPVLSNGACGACSDEYPSKLLNMGGGLCKRCDAARPRCSGCIKRYTKATLAKNKGICGRCVKLL